jgi:predicted AlkP superfamily phosphohydrolase/phosphomutase
MTIIRHEPVKRFGKDIDINKSIKEFYDEVKKYITKTIRNIPKEKYRNIIKGAYERPEKYVSNKKQATTNQEELFIGDFIS